MGRITFDYDFESCYKPCEGPATLGEKKRDKYPCAGKECPWYRMCDLEGKNPPEPPTLPKEGVLIF